MKCSHRETEKNSAIFHYEFQIMKAREKTFGKATPIPSLLSSKPKPL